MALVDWSTKLELGIPSVDSQHQRLVEILNTLDESKRRGKGSRVMGDLLQQLIDYTVEHFAHEEKLMTEAGYPQLDLHMVQHRQLVEKVLHFQHQFRSGGQRITKELMGFLKYWLESHILKDDMAYGDFMAAGGIPAETATTLQD